MTQTLRATELLACRTGVIFLRFAGKREGERGAPVTRATGLGRETITPVQRDSRSALASARLKAQKKNCACSAGYRVAGYFHP